MQEWIEHNLGYLFVEEDKSPIQVQHASGFGEFPFFTSGDNVLKHNASLIDGKNIFLATGGKANIKFYVGKASYSTDTYVLSSEKADTKFLYYLLLSKIDFINSNLFTGSGLKHLQKNDLRKLKVKIPKEKTEQEKIASILSEVDESISQTENLIAKYQRIKTGMMQDLLTKGIDGKGNIRSKATHKFVVKNGIEVPEEWRVEYLGDVCSKIQDGTHFSPKTSDDGEFMYLTSKNIRLGYLDLSNVEYINRKQHEDIYRRCTVKLGDVLLTKDGANTGNATVNNIQEQFSLLSSVCLIRGKEDVLNNDFLLSLLICERGQRLIKDSMSGLAITRVTLQIINKFIFPIPPPLEQIEISNRIQQMENAILIFRKDLKKLNSIKTGLMQDLLSGKVRVK